MILYIVVAIVAVVGVVLWVRDLLDDPDIPDGE
jgi:hypothetical protein